MKTLEAKDTTILDALYRHTKIQPETVAYEDGKRAMTFIELERKTNQIANALVALNIKSGDRVATLTKFHFECLLLTLAACKIGAVCMPVNWRLASEELTYILGHGQAKLVMTDAAFISGVNAITNENTQTSSANIFITDATVQGFKCFSDWYSGFSEQFQAIKPQPDDAALQLYSSGTTGLPKGVVLTHRGLMSTNRTVSKDWQFDNLSVLGNPLPTFHVACQTMMLLTLYKGAKTVAYSEFDAVDFLAGISKNGITHSFLVPAMLMFMLQSSERNKNDYATLKIIAYGGSPISDRVLQDSMALFNCDFLQVYGLTEVSGPATFLDQQDHRNASQSADLLRSAGKPIGGAKLRIVDPITQKDVPDGGSGEIWIETIRNFKEYWRDPRATEAAFPEGRNDRGGWFRSGDGGYIKEGYLYIHDRIKDMIISGGENIYPAEIENLLMRHADVADGAIIGIPDPVWGEAVKACVVLREGACLSEKDLIEWMRARMAHFKCPKSVDFMAVMPRNPTGKLLKRVLREPYWLGKERSVN